MKCIASMATVATAPPARREAAIPPAMSICESTQPPKMWPLALMSVGPGTTRKIGSLVESLILIALYVGVRHFLVVPASGTQEGEHHQSCAEQHGQTDTERYRNQEARVGSLVAPRHEKHCNRGDRDR